MQEIIDIMSRLTNEDARSALYYAGRYIKQSDRPEGEKDIFEEENRSTPSTIVKEATLQIVKAIEIAEGRRSQTFDEATRLKILILITDIESDVLLEMTEEKMLLGKNLASTIN